MYYYFRLEFGNYHRYSQSFTLDHIPSLEDQAMMVQIYFAPYFDKDGELRELIGKYGFTGFELCFDEVMTKDPHFYDLIPQIKGENE